MSTINGFDSNANSMNTLLSGLGATNSGSSSDGLFGINVIDYNTIKSGSYSKLMKAYYAEGEEETTAKKSKNDTDDSDGTIREIKSTAAELKDSAQALYASKSLFAKNADGEYDMEAIYEKLNTFIEDFNATVKAVGSAETESIAKAGANLVNALSSNTDMLKKIGITVNASDYTLSVNKDTFMNSRITDVKSLLSGVGSFAYQVGAKASRIYSMVEDKVSSGGFVSGSKDSESTSSTSKDNANTIARAKETADDLVATGTDLYKNRDLFDKTLDGEYDTDEILEEIGAFIKDYNDLVISTENSKSSGISNHIKSMLGITDAYAKDLAAIGITIDKEDDTLKLDEASFLKADMKDAKNLFIGTGSLAYQITAKAAMVASQAETEASKSNTYTEGATYSNNYNTGSIFNDIV